MGLLAPFFVSFIRHSFPFCASAFPFLLFAAVGAIFCTK
jgi:hypothetical protein